MKKLLATLLVAMMIMSCMTVVSFAANTTAYTLENFFDASFAATTTETPGMFGQPGTKSTAYNDNFIAMYYARETGDANLMGWLSGADNADKLFYQMALQIMMNNAAAVPTATTLSAGEYVALPVYVTDAASVKVKITYDPTYFTFDNASSYGWANVVVDTESSLYANFGSATNVSGLLGVVYFKVNDLSALTGDENGLGESAISFELDSECYLADENGVSGTVGVSSMTVPVAGLTPGAAEDDEPTDITSDEVAAIAPVVAGTFAAENMVADIKTAYGVDVSSELADVYDAANMSYVPVFATFPTTDKNAPEAYGIILKGEGMEDVKVAGKNANNGMYGVIFYGFTGHLAKYTEAYAYVTVGGVTYTSALGSIN